MLLPALPDSLHASLRVGVLVTASLRSPVDDEVGFLEQLLQRSADLYSRFLEGGDVILGGNVEAESL